MGGARLEPFLKWAGGKRWLVDTPSFSTPKTFNNYIEPFLGGAAVFLALQPRRAILSDLNEELIETYRVVVKHPDEILARLTSYQAKHSKELFYKVRSQDFEDPIDRAARFLYLNRTCWNGLYRVNKKGAFNVPIGTKSRIVFEGECFHRFADAFKDAEFDCCDFEKSIDRAGDGDFVFCDPPYTTAHNQNCFLKYNENIFSWNDQIRLAEASFRAKERGAHVVITNAAHDSVIELYANAKSTRIVERHSVISGTAAGRSRTAELLVAL